MNKAQAKKSVNKPDFEADLIDSRQLSKLIGRSLKWVEIHRKKILSSHKLGGKWAFSLSEIKSRIATGRPILITK